MIKRDHMRVRSDDRDASNRRGPSWTFACASLLAISVPACALASDDDLLDPTVELVDRTTQPLTTGALRWANGTYGSSCTNHANGDPWSLRISGADAMDHAALAVVKKNSACALTLTGLVADQAYEATPVITMAATYQATSSTFATRVAGVLQPTAFYGNALITSPAMTTDFTVTIRYFGGIDSSDLPVQARRSCIGSIFCDDFDQGALGATWTSTVQTRGTVTLGTVRRSTPNALRAELLTGSSPGDVRLRKVLPSNPTNVKCEFDFYPQTLPASGRTDLLIVTTNGGSPDNYDVSFMYNGGTYYIAEYAPSPAINRTASITAPTLGEWTHVLLQTSGTVGTLTVGATTTTLTGLSVPAGTSRTVSAGVKYPSSTAATAVFLYDNVRCQKLP